MNRPTTLNHPAKTVGKSLEDRSAGRTRLLIGLEFLFYFYIFFNGFAHLFWYVPYLASVIQFGIAAIAVVSSPIRSFWGLGPGLIVLLIAVIDWTGYSSLDTPTILLYFSWFLLFVTLLVIHQDPGFFNRAKIVLLIFLLCHFTFLDLDPIESRFILQERLHLTLGNSNDLAYWCSFGMFVSLVAMTQAKFMGRLFFLLTACGSIMVLLGTGSRGAILFLMVSGLPYGLTVFRKHRLLVVVAVLTLVVVSLGPMQSFFWDKIALFQRRIEVEQHDNYSFSTRTPLFFTAIETFLRSPWMGTGDNFVYPVDVSPNSPHNAFLAIAVHYGFLPALLLLGLWGAIFWKLWFLVWGARRGPPEWGHLSLELSCFIGFIFLMSNISDLMVLSPFAALYMTKVLALPHHMDMA